MQAHIPIVTLGVAHVAAASALYQRMGFEPAEGSNDTVCFMQAGGVVVSLFGRQALAEDAHWPEGDPSEHKTP